MNHRSFVMYADSETNANMYYATRFLAPDPFICVGKNSWTSMILGDLEIGRAHDEADVDRIYSHTTIVKALRARAPKRKLHTADIIRHVLRQKKIRRVEVPWNFPVEMADTLRKRGIRVKPIMGAFFPSRPIKTPQEIRAIEQSQRRTEEAVSEAFDILRRASIRGDRIVYKGRALTAEFMKEVINGHLIRKNAFVRNPIVACGDQGCDPHNRGSGPLRPHQSIVFDIFPRSMDTLYWADMTRTVVKGKASPKLKRQYQAVLDAQNRGIELCKDGADGKKVHDEVKKVLEDRGYKTAPRGNKMEGFFHGTGHGVGLDIHEPPSIGAAGTPLPENSVVTVEPGLYYFGVGGIRIEDMVLVRKRDCRNLTKFPRFLEIDEGWR